VAPARRAVQGDTVEQLLPLFLSLLKDDWPDVRLAIIGKLQAVNQVGCEAAGRQGGRDAGSAMQATRCG
jgi:hypothetical protein